MPGGEQAGEGGRVVRGEDRGERLRFESRKTLDF